MTKDISGKWQIPKLSALLLLATAVLIQLNARLFVNQEYIAILCFGLVAMAAFSFYCNVSVDWLIFGIVFLIYACIQIFISKDLSSMECRIEMLATIMLALMILVLSVFSSVKPLQIPTSALLYITSAISVIVIISYFLNKPLLLGLIDAPPNGERAVGGFTGPNELANANVIILTYSVFYHFYIKKIRFLYLFSVPIVWALVLSWSRGGLIEFAVLAIAMVFIIFRRKSKNKSLWIFVAMIVIVIGAFLVYKYFIPLVQEKREDAGDRMYILKFALEQFEKSPVWGNGYAYTTYQNFLNDTPHNEFLLYLINGGILGVTILVVLFGKLIITAYKKRLYPELMAVIMFCFTEITFNNLVRYKTAILFWILMAIIIVSPKREKALRKDNIRHG